MGSSVLIAQREGASACLNEIFSSLYLYFTAKRKADENSACSIPEIMEILPDDKMRHIKEKVKMNSTYPCCFTSYISLLSATQTSEKQTQSSCLFLWLLVQDRMYFTLNSCGLKTQAVLGAGHSHTSTCVC